MPRPSALARRAAPRHRPDVSRRWILLLYVLPALLLAAGTVPFLISPELDLELSRPFYVAGADLWKHAGDQPWNFLYKRGTLPALAVALVSFCLLVLSIGRPRLARSRKVTAYFVLVLLLGPGLIANTLLKDGWGRPRPREVVEFGGREPFEPVLTVDPASDGTSFVSGHATMGFYFFAVGLVLLASGRRVAGALTLLAALVVGLLIGIARMVQGGHFASDVLWAAGVVWFTAAGLFPVFRFHRGVRYVPARPVGSMLRPWVPAIILIGLIIIMSVVGLAWPYPRTKETTLLPESVTILPDTVVLDLDLEGTLELVPGDELLLVTESRGAGFPKSSLASKRVFVTDGAQVEHLREGWFRVLHAHTRLTLPPNRVYKITLHDRFTDVFVPPEKREGDQFAHVRLTTPHNSKLKRLPGKIVDEDFFGRKTRAFSF